jgi:hypothetical protein
MKRIQKNGNNIDPLLQTGCFSSVVSSSTNTIAPVPHGPGLLRQEPSVNATFVYCGISGCFSDLLKYQTSTFDFLL